MNGNKMHIFTRHKKIVFCIYIIYFAIGTFSCEFCRINVCSPIKTLLN